MKKSNLLTLTLVCLIIVSCGSTKKAIQDIPRAIPITKGNEWTLEKAPNGHDVVGVIFALEPNGNVKRVPGGNLNIKTSTAPIEVASQTFTKSVSAGAVVNFLGLKNIGAGSNLSVSDSSHLDVTFSIANGMQTIIVDENVASIFKEKKAALESNMEFFNLKNLPLFIILETIQSPSVSITFDKTRDKSAAFAASFKELISANPHVSASTVDKTDLIYKRDTPVTVFYKLQKINMNVIGAKGDEPERMVLSLGEKVRSDELVYKKKEE